MNKRKRVKRELRKGQCTKDNRSIATRRSSKKSKRRNASTTGRPPRIKIQKETGGRKLRTRKTRNHTKQKRRSKLGKGLTKKREKYGYETIKDGTKTVMAKTESIKNNRSNHCNDKEKEPRDVGKITR